MARIVVGVLSLPVAAFAVIDGYGPGALAAGVMAAWALAPRDRQGRVTV